MSVTYTTKSQIQKPTVGNSYNTWGNEFNTTLDLIDEIVMSNNFAENAASHSGLNFYYKNGRVQNGTTTSNVSASYVTLTDNNTNYIEVNLSGTVSANVTGFTAGSIPLYTCVVSSGVQATAIDKRCFFHPATSQLWTLSTDSVNTAYNVVVGTGTKKTWDTTYEYIQLSGNNSLAYTKTATTSSKLFISNNVYYDSGDTRWEYITTDEASQIILEDGTIKLKTLTSGTADDPSVLNNCLVVDENQNTLLNNATAETSSVGAWTIKQGTDPTTSGADQISVFATAGANSTLGLRTEAAVAAETDETKFSHKLAVKINGTDYFIMLCDS
jgi:hypothetical protein